MRVVCAWCGAVLSEGEGAVSHGICRECEVLFERAYLRGLAERRRQPRRVRVTLRAGAPLPGFEHEGTPAGRPVCAAPATSAAGR